MTEAGTILKLIESVDPADTAALDEIDARVKCWIIGQIYLGSSKCGKFALTGTGQELERVIGFPLYTRSRDALKAIRPDGWNFNFTKNGFYYYFELNKLEQCGFYRFFVGSSLTEELSELSAIIQALSHERQ